MTVLVTGATGNIGKHVVRGLVGAGQPVRAMTRTPESAATRLPAGVAIVAGDFEQPATWEPALAGVDRVHLFPFADPAPAAGPSFIEVAVAAGVRRFVVHSAAAAGFDYLGEPDDLSLSALDRHLADERQWHLSLEQAVAASGAEWTHVRPGLLATWALAWADEIRTTGTVRAPFPQAGNPLVHEADVAEVAVAALITDAHLGQVYTITGPTKITQEEQVREIGVALGRELRLVELTPEAARQEWLDPAQGMDDELLDWLLPTIELGLAPGGAVPATGDFERITGRPPRTFAQWARDHVEDFR
ncbi:NAD(P)H-binding protein [Natronosporangium hydrolyticum]|uniref:NAD(P)H-binding protein n=1 Tax=Natronosporangium hydrolyticum TaxID=2811111 RepID=A0A895YJT4_9ACTN|nr:NAD(P)H-binding protein [Natronosporangium hydrolyticum]QSB14370.1 NAD(P)H-binding protein [Natronosporangium hydrolyticum]